MPLFGHKKTRTTLAATIGASSTFSGRLDQTLHNRSVLLRLFLCLIAMIGLVIAVEGWKTPFRYRLGDHPAEGILAKVDFKQLNRFETDQARSDAEDRVALIFLHDPESLQSLSLNLTSDLKAVADSESLDSLPTGVRAAFGLLPPDQPAAGATAGVEKQPPVDESQNQYLVLKQAVTPAAKAASDDTTTTSEDAVIDPVQDIVADFAQFIAPLSQHGIIDPNDIAANKIRPEQKIAVVVPESAGAQIELLLADVQLSDQLRDSGKLGATWSEYTDLLPIRVQLQRWLAANVRPTLSFDSEATQEARHVARENVAEVYDSYNKANVLVAPGQLIDEVALSVLSAEYDEIERLVPFTQRVTRVLTVFLMILVLAVMNGSYLIRNEPHLVNSPVRLSVYLVAIIAAAGLARILSMTTGQAEVIPLLVAVMVFAVAYNQVLATLTAFTLCLIVTLSTVAELSQFVVLMSVSATAVMTLSRVPSRSRLIKVGFCSGATFFIVSWGTGIMQSQSLGSLWSDSALLINSLRGAGWCLAAGYLVAGSLPFVESAFGVVTDISLLEMSDISHPLLNELVRRAPGTYNHSISVATISEAAADRIGANGLLVRVGAYFHDIGKMLKPQYFIENMTHGAESRHEHLAPAMSTLIIIGHVKDGVDLARQHNLPQPLIDFIEQHHGTTLVEYFYREAAKQADLQPDHRTDAEESSFRYPGPKPQTREAGVMMLADAVESASRTLSDPTPKRIENLVHNITMRRLLDNQFEECSLTLREVRIIEESLTKSLIGIYHGRIKYPEQRTA